MTTKVQRRARRRKRAARSQRARAERMLALDTVRRAVTADIQRYLADKLSLFARLGGNPGRMTILPASQSPKPVFLVNVDYAGLETRTCASGARERRGGK